MEKQKVKVDLQVDGIKAKIALDKIKQARKTSFKAIAIKKRETRAQSELLSS